MNAQALTGIRVVDLTRYLSGPMAAMLLGDLGADVVKVETLPGGDAARQSGPFHDGESVYYMASNRNKRSLAVDLRSDAGREVMLRLLDSADVFIENFRPGTAERMGLGYEALHARNPRLVYASISGFGNTEAGAQLPGFDQTVQAMSGLMSVTGTEETGPLRTGIAIADASTGVFASLAIVSALLQRERTGEGVKVEASLMQSLLSLINYQAQAVLSLGVVPQPVGNDHPIMFPQGTFKTSDGAITIACGNEKMWRLLCDALDCPDLAADERYDTNAGRMEHRKELRRRIEAALASRTSTEWIAIVNDAGVPCGPVLRIDEALAHPTTQALGMVQRVRHPLIGDLDVLGKSIDIGDAPDGIDRHPPLLGEHSVEVLTELGLSVEDIDALMTASVIEQASVPLQR